MTPEGETFHERCRKLLDDVAEAEAELTSHSGEAIGQIKNDPLRSIDPLRWLH